MITNSVVNINFNEIISALDTFEPLPLYKMSKVTLMDRTDIKYVFSVKRLPELLIRLNDKYKVMEILKERSFPYSTTYLDTHDLLFYRQHVTGKLERYKIRFRKYESSGVSYLEIKKKTKKNRTEKVRIANHFNPDGFDQRADCFITTHTPYKSQSLKPILISTFKRTTLVNLESNERITIDFDLKFSSPGIEPVGLPSIAITELKRDRFSNHSPFIEVIKDLGIHSARFSKYCVGSHFTGSVSSYGHIKPMLLIIKKIEDEYNVVHDKL
jgi:hypothetical protein